MIKLVEISFGVTLPAQKKFTYQTGISLLNKKSGLGIKNCSSVNVAFMAKLNWEIATNKEKLWVNLFLHKYNYRRPLKHSNTSYIYKSIFKDNNLFQNFTSVTIKTGDNTDLWRDKWLRNTTLRSHLIGPFPYDESLKKVSSFILNLNGTPS